MYREGSEEYKHHVGTYGPPDKFGYKDFIPIFKAERYDPTAWGELFKKAGAKYVVPVAEHHDGFAMYDSGVSDWTAAKMGPHRDLIGDLGKAVRAAGLHFGVSSHRVEHNFFLGVGRCRKHDVGLLCDQCRVPCVDDQHLQFRKCALKLRREHWSVFDELFDPPEPHSLCCVLLQRISEV